MPQPTYDPIKKFFYDNGILTKLPLERRNALLGELVTLLLASRLHCEYYINDIGVLFLPPIHLNQFRMYRQKNKAIGFVTWAFLTAEVEDKYLNSRYQLKLEDWNAGDRLWIMDFVAPFGHAKPIIRDLRHNVAKDLGLEGQTARVLRIRRNGAVKGFVRWRGGR